MKNNTGKKPGRLVLEIILIRNNEPQMYVDIKIEEIINTYKWNSPGIDEILKVNSTIYPSRIS